MQTEQELFEEYYEPGFGLVNMFVSNKIVEKSHHLFIKMAKR